MADGLGKLLGTAPTVPNVLDYAQIKRFEEPFAGGRYLRFVLLGVCCLLYWRAYGGVLLLWWFAGLMAAQLLHYAALRSLPDAGPRQLMWRILVTQGFGSADGAGGMDSPFSTRRKSDLVVDVDGRKIES